MPYRKKPVAFRDPREQGWSTTTARLLLNANSERLHLRQVQTCGMHLHRSRYSVTAVGSAAVPKIARNTQVAAAGRQRKACISAEGEHHNSTGDCSLCAFVLHLHLRRYLLTNAAPHADTAITSADTSAPTIATAAKEKQSAPVLLPRGNVADAETLSATASTTSSVHDTVTHSKP